MQSLTMIGSACQTLLNTEGMLCECLHNPTEEYIGEDGGKFGIKLCNKHRLVILWFLNLTVIQPEEIDISMAAVNSQCN